jgi:hypothetical protein
MAGLNAQAQDAHDQYWDRQSANAERKQNMNRLLANIEHLSMNAEPGMRRVSVLNIAFSKKDLTERTADLLRTEIENALLRNGFAVVKIPEMLATPQTHVEVKDSMVRISRIKPINQIRSNSDSLTALARKYGVQCFVDCNLAYDEAKGYLLGIQLYSSLSRELISSATLMSNPTVVDWAFSDYILSGGLGAFPKAEVNNSNDTLGWRDAASMYFKADFAWRQPISFKKTSYFGFNVGLNIVQTNTAKTSYTYFLAHGGARYYLAFFERDKVNASHYIEWVQGLGIYAARDFNLYAEEGLTVNITENMGLTGTFNYIFKDMHINYGEVKTGNIGYTISAFYNF